MPTTSSSPRTAASSPWSPRGRSGCARSTPSRRARSTEPAGATYPFFSPDGSTIGFFADNELRRIPRDGGTVQKLCDAPDARGGAWAPDGTIVFSDRFGKEGLFRVGNRGGKAVALPRVAGATAPGEDRYPQFLPDGRRFLFVRLSGSPEEAGVYVGDLDGAPPLRVLDGSENALYTPARHRTAPATCSPAARDS